MDKETIATLHRPGTKTSEFRMVLLFVAVVLINSAVRTYFGHGGLSDQEIYMIGGVTVYHWYGRMNFKRELLRARNDNAPLPLTQVYVDPDKPKEAVT